MKIRVLITITMNQHMNWTRSCVFFFSLFKYHRDVVRAQTNRNLPNSNRSDAFKYIMWYFGQMRSACIHFNVSTTMEDRINTCIQLENEYFSIKHLSFHLSRCFETDSNNPFQNPKRHIVRKASHISSPLKSMLNRRLQFYFHYTLFSTQREEEKKVRCIFRHNLFARLRWYSIVLCNRRLSTWCLGDVCVCMCGITIDWITKSQTERERPKNKTRKKNQNQFSNDHVEIENIAAMNVII